MSVAFHFNGVGKTLRVNTAKQEFISPDCKAGETDDILGAMKRLDSELAKEAKVIVVLGFRNVPIEDVHAGKLCPVCNGSSEYSRITDDEMKAMMKSAVNAVYKLL